MGPYLPDRHHVRVNLLLSDVFLCNLSSVTQNNIILSYVKLRPSLKAWITTYERWLTIIFYKDSFWFCVMLTLTSPRMSISAPASAQQNSICNFGQKSVFRKMMLKSEMRQSRAAELMLHWSQWPVAVMCQCPDGITGYSPRRALHRQQALTTICEKMSNSDLKTERSPNGL